MKLAAMPTRAIFVVGNTDASLTISGDVKLNDIEAHVANIANLPATELADARRWLAAKIRWAGDSYEINDDTGDTVALIVLV